MNYNIKSTELSITDEIRGYVEKRLSTLDKFLSNVDASRADVELEFLHSEAKQYRAGFMVRDPGLPESLRASAKGSTLHEAIDIAVGELFQELTRGKKKRLHLLRRSGQKVKEYLRGWRDKS